MSPKVVIAILNFNTRNFLEKYLPSIMKTDYPNFEVLVIDNASNDDSVEFLQREYPQVKLVVLDRNYGFAGGYNEGLKGIEAPYYVLLNTDVEVTPEWVTPIIQHMELDSSIAASQPKILSYRDGHLFEYAGASGGFIDRYGYPFCRGRIFNYCEKDEGQYNDIIEVFWASGAALFIRQEAWRSVQGFDADFFAHMEEVDLCWRLKNRGWKITCVPHSRIYHVGGGTLTRENPRKTRLNFRNALITIVKNMSFGELLWKMPYRLILDGIAGIRFFLKGEWSSTLAILQAHFLFYAGFIYWTRKRRESRKIKNPNKTGILKSSIVLAHYFFRIKTYKQLEHRITKR